VESGADAELNVYEGMPHAHHAISHLPEAAEALQELANFFDRKLQ
jgi:acetyl esterase/lipase